MSAGIAVYTLLTGDATVQSLSGGRIFARVARQATVRPYLVYWEVDSVLQPVVDAMAPSLMDARVQVTAIAEDYAGCKALVAAGIAACKNQHGTIGGVTVYRMMIDNVGSDDFDQATMLYMQSFDVMTLYQDVN